MFGGGAHATRCGLEFFGADHVVFATDTPLGPIAPTIEIVKNLNLRRRNSASCSVATPRSCSR